MHAYAFGFADWEGVPRFKTQNQKEWGLLPFKSNSEIYFQNMK